MKRTRLPRSFFRTAHGSSASRAGVTLIEVMISLLVMSVAVSSVMILFPLSLLRSVKGRQLTQATILRYNAENQLDLHPGLANGLPSHRPAILDPLGWHLMQETRIALNLPRPRNSPPNKFLNEDRFGNYANNPPPPNLPERRLLRTNGGTTSDVAARKLVSLPDTWIGTTRGIPDNYNPGNATTFPTLIMPSDVDLSDIPTAPLGISRVTVFDPTARFSDVRTITNISGKTLTLLSPLSPRVFDANNKLGEARIEILEQRYTWMLTVRSSVRSADVVVFFRRSFSTEDEQIYPTVFNPIFAGKPNRRILITWSGGAANKPSMRRNGFVFDVQNALWYRIHRIENETADQAELVLDEVIKRKGRRGAILMRGIVDVYPISF